MSDSEERAIRLSIQVPGSPEEVWAAIATGNGITSWFVPTEVEERAGGVVRHDFGAMGTDTGSVVAWEPPRRVVFEGGAAMGRVLAFEWLVEAASGDTCIVRLVNTGFAEGADWDEEFDGMEMGWRLFLENLRLHLTHFPSQRAVGAVPVAMVAGPNERAWQELCDAYALQSDLSDDSAATLVVGESRWSGRIERVMAAAKMRHYMLLVNQPPAAGFLAAEGEGDMVSISAYMYFYGSDANKHADTWRHAWAANWPAPAG